MPTLYLAISDEYDVRESFTNLGEFGDQVKWLVYTSMVRETNYQKGDVLVVSSWVVSERGELLDIAEQLRHIGGRAVFVGTKSNETAEEEWKSLLVRHGIYDWIFMSPHEVNLIAIQTLILNPHSIRDVSAYLPESLRNKEDVSFVEITGEVLSEEKGAVDDNHVVNYGKPKKQIVTQRVVEREVIRVPTIKLVSQRSILFTSLYPRSGVTTLTMLAAMWLAENGEKVAVVEAPSGEGKLSILMGWEHGKPEEDGDPKVDHVVDHEVTWFPSHLSIHTDFHENPLEAMRKRLYKLRDYSVVLIDGGYPFEDEEIAWMVDAIWLIVDADPVELHRAFVPHNQQEDTRLKWLQDTHHAKTKLIINRSSELVKRNQDVFPNAAHFPQLDHEAWQKCLWNYQSALADRALSPSIEAALRPLLGNMVTSTTEKKKKRFSLRW